MDIPDLELPRNIRCYNGCYDSTTQRQLDRQSEVLDLIKRKEPEAHVTYYPVEEEYLVHVWGRPLSGYHKTSAGALTDAYWRLHPERCDG